MDARLLDEIAAAATPASTEADVGGWRCRASPDLPFRRASAVTPPPGAAGGGRRAAELAAVRHWCAGHGVRLIVQVSTADPDHLALDAWLADEGLRLEAPVQVLVAEEEAAGPGAAPVYARRATGLTVAVSRRVDAVAASHLAAGLEDADPVARARIEAYGRMLHRHGDRALVAVAGAGPEVVGLGFGVVDRGWLGIFGMVTSPAHRRRGAATGVVRALRAVAPGPSYLQVEDDNAAALRLYEHLGFGLHHRYHYRTAPALPSPAR